MTFHLTDTKKKTKNPTKICMRGSRMCMVKFEDDILYFNGAPDKRHYYTI